MSQLPIEGCSTDLLDLGLPPPDATAPEPLAALGLDLVVVPGSPNRGSTDLDRRTRRALVACERAGIPTVAVADDRSDLESVLVGLACVVVASSPETAELGRTRFGHERTVLAPPVIDTRRFNPSRRSAEPATGLLVVDESGEARSHLRELMEAVQTDGRDVRVIEGDTSPDQILELASRSAVAVSVGAPATPGSRRREVALSALGVPIVRTRTRTRTRADVGGGDRGTAGVVRDLIANPDRLEITGIEASRVALRDHSLSAFLDAVLPAVGITPMPPSRISIVVELGDPAHIANIERNVARQRYPELEVVLVTHSDAVTDESFDGWPAEQIVNVVRPPKGATRAERLAFGVRAAAGESIALMDARAVYGPWHVMDLALAAEFTGAEIVGRAGCALYDPDRDVTGWWGARSAAAPPRRLAPATLLVRRETALRYGFVRTNTDPYRSLVQRVSDGGGLVHAIHGFDTLLIGSVRDSGGTRGFDSGAALPFGDGGVPAVGPRSEGAR